jgi:nucleotide-binding universal stress UspA family protein/predicted phosphoribosyltransferase
MELRTILVALDFDPASTRALELACSFGSRDETTMVLFHCCDVRSSAYATEVSLGEVMRGLRAGAATALEALARSMRDAGYRVRTLVAEGAAHAETIRAARDSRADLILVGTHGRRGLSRVVLGSVAERVVRTSPVPVLSTHEWYFETREDAGIAIAKAAMGAGDRFDRVVATSAGAAPIAAAAANALAAVADVFVVEPLMVEGDEPMMCGVVSELGAMIDVPTAVEHGLARPARAARRAVQRADEESHRLRGDETRASFAGQSLLVIVEAMDRPEVGLFALEALLAAGAERVAVGAPLCARRTIEELRREGVRTLCPIPTVLSPPAVIFHESAGPNDEQAAKALERASSSTAS